MGRSYLSIKLAAVFGLVVAAAVTAQQQTVAERAMDSLESMEIVLPAEALSEVETAIRAVKAECDAVEATVLVHTPRARAHAPKAPAAGRS